MATTTTTAATTATTFDPVPRLAAQLQLPARGVAAVVELLDDKATVPFIARYRKEKTGGLDEVQIRAIGEARDALLELEDRRTAIIASVSSQGTLTPAIEKALRAATTKTELEDLYLPFKQKRKTRASIARERGLTDLADRIIAQGRGDPRKEAAAFVKGEVVDVDAALAGAQDIVAEAVADSPQVRQLVRETFAREGFVSTKKAKPKDTTPTRFDDYADYGEPLSRLPSHRVHAILRGESEGVLKVDIDVDAGKLGPRLEQLVGIERSSPWAALYVDALKDAYKRLIVPSVENDLRTALKQKADLEAIDVFANNLDKLLLAPPLGPRAVVGIDPGLRTGCKCVAIDASGLFVETVTIYPSRGGAAEAEAATVLRAFVAKHKPFAVGIGNGTGGRETETFAK
ncbi:MAG TPA: Tex-like N-terminal domain-containing protein, partial [Myxococcota bacterium]